MKRQKEKQREMKRVCIVGAGMSGLCTCKYMKEQQGLGLGLVPLVLEASGSVGGVWRSTYDSTILQNSYSTYQFSDFPWPPSTPRHPTHRQVLAYFEAYAHHFNLFPYIKFHSKLISLQLQQNSQSPTSTWIVTYVSTHSNGDTTTNRMEFDFVVLCTGRFGDVPRLPTFSSPSEGPQIFGGKVLHAMDYSALNKDQARKLFQGKRVAVVGFHKSALDIAMEASHINKGMDATMETLLIYRRPYWFIPDNSRWEAMIAFLYFTRFSEFLNRKPGRARGLWDLFLYPLRWAISKFVETTLLHALPLQENALIPNESFVDQMASCLIAKPPPLLFERVQEGRIRLWKSPNWSFYEKGLVLNAEDDGCNTSQTQLAEVDVVILATGYDSQTKLLRLIPEEYRDQLFDSKGVLPLYRGIIPCTIPNMAILGYQHNFANIHSSEMGARWLSNLLAGHFELPDSKTMRKEAQTMADYVRDSTFPSHSCLGLVQIGYADQLCKDMGWNPRRKHNFLQELFSPYTNLDYIQQ